MKKLFSFFTLLLVAVCSYAYDFAGKTFRGEETVDGRKVTVTYRFKPNGRLSGNLSVAGQKPQVDNNMIWEVAGDYINYYDSVGDYGYLMIDEEDGKVVLVGFDSLGHPAMTFHEVASTPKKSTGTNKGTTRKSTKKR